jgi:hypothetical protein
MLKLPSIKILSQDSERRYDFTGFYQFYIKRNVQNNISVMYSYIIIINKQQHPQIRHVITGLSRRGRANKQEKKIHRCTTNLIRVNQVETR